MISGNLSTLNMWGLNNWLSRRIKCIRGLDCKMYCVREQDPYSLDTEWIEVIWEQ